ncbi:MAG: hypothetical protein ABIE43_03780 [Patescibacteria group bacterium]
MNNYQINKLKKEIKKLMTIKGEARGAVFKTDASYVISKKGEEGLGTLKEMVKKMDLPISYDKDIIATGWYPLSWRVSSLLIIKEVFNFDDKDIFEMGKMAPKYSFIVKTLLRYFVSVKKTFEESAKYWEEHYTVGKLEAPEINVKDKHLVLHLKNFNVYPVFCIYLAGYFETIANMVVKTGKMKIKEEKCSFAGDSYHEYIINWE